MLNQNYEDQQLQCVECGQYFSFSAEDQEFYQSKGYSSPKRCPVCRQNRKAQGNRGGGGQRHERPQYEVVCDECGCTTTVPFRPSSDKPVFCSDCYNKKKGY